MAAAVAGAPAAQAQAQGALAAALAEAFGRAERVAEEVRELERTVTEVRSSCAAAESGALVSATEEVADDSRASRSSGRPSTRVR